jgi:hypothetical protein
MAQELIQGDSTDFIRYHDSSAYKTCVYACTGLGAAETVAIARSVGGTFVTLTSFDAASATNVAVLFTGSGGTPASVSFIEVAGGNYRFDVSGDPAGTVLITADVGEKKV